MSLYIGIRREDKNKWERRAPITPAHVKELKEKHDINTIVQPSDIRVFKDEEYKKVGAEVNEDLSHSKVVFGIKEMPLSFFQKNKTYVFFSHTIKGQKYNMPMLKKMIELDCNLVDYEKITDKKGRRLVFFGRYAGIAGMIDTLWAFGKRLEYKGIKTPFSEIKKTIDYNSLEEAKNHIRYIGGKIKEEGIPETLSPIVVGFAGYGHVSTGAQEILDILPVEEIGPGQLEKIQDHYDPEVIYKVIFKEKDMVEPVSPERLFNLEEYYTKPNLYHSIFTQYISRLSILMNCIYWDERYPRLLTKDFLEENFTGRMKLEIVGDISIDINGAIEFTEKATKPDDPVYVYNPITRDVTDGYKGKGVLVMSVDNLPCELPKESSVAFSNSLISFIPEIAKADYDVDFQSLGLPEEIKKAVILHRGKLTLDYRYIKEFL
jgi:saccharopine dehydrogenase (NAD+, L-lysine forming)